MKHCILYLLLMIISVACKAQMQPKGRIQNLDRIYFNVYDRTHKLIATVERQRYKEGQFRVQINVLRSDKTFSFADVAEDKVLLTSAKMLVADNILW